jgi:hypothetical protein
MYRNAMRGAALVLAAILAGGGSGCMTSVAATIKPGPHADVFVVGGLGAVGDTLVALGASAGAAAATEDDEEPTAYFLPIGGALLVVDAIVALIVLESRFGD